MQIRTQEGPFRHTLKKVLDAERAVLKALPEMESKATDLKLKQALSSYRNETEEHILRLEGIFASLGKAEKPKAIVDLIEEPFDLVAMMRNFGQYFSGQAEQEGIEFITDLPGQSIVINSSETRLSQLFVNLISNAISFSEEGDTIRMWLRRRESRVLIAVEDTGLNIPNQAVTKIFQRCYSKDSANGSGDNLNLDLAICNQVVESHGGVIWVENIRSTDVGISSHSLGTRFVVGLPV